MNEETTTILIDTALASGSASALDPEERALQELVLAIRDDAPTPAADFRLRMDARVAAGFPPRRARRRLAIPAFAMKRPRLAALGAAASLLIAVVVAGSLAGRSSNPTVAESPKTPVPAVSNGAANSGAIGGGTAVAPSKKRAPSHAPAVLESAPSAAAIQGIPFPNSDVRGGRNRHVSLSAALVLSAPQDKFSQVGDQIVAVTDRYSGIVMHSSITDTGNGNGTGSYDLRIPVRNLPQALRDLSALADVQSRTENSDDVTASFVSARTRIQELKAERKSLLKQLASATTTNQVDSIKARLGYVNSELNYQTQALQRLTRRTSFASVSVTLNEKAKKHGSSGGGGISRGARDLRKSLVDSTVIALRVLGIAIPIAILVALLWAGNAILTRRSREAALDSRL